MLTNQSPAIDPRLVESEARYHTVIENDMIQSILPDGRFEFVNRAWLDVFGYTLDEVHDLSSKPQGQGTSLGLDTAWRIMTEEHHGMIEVESHLGQITLRVPLPCERRESSRD